MSEEFPVYKHLQFVSKCLGQNIFSGPKRGKWEKIHLIFFLLALAIVYVLTLLWRFRLKPTWASNLYNLMYLTFLLCNLFSLYTLNFSQRTGVCALLKNISLLYKELAKQFPEYKVKEETHFNVYFVGIHILYLLFMFYQHYVILALKYPFYTGLSLIVFNYLVILTALQYSCVVFTIKNLLNVLNEKVYEYKTIKINPQDMRSQMDATNNLRFLLKSYNNIFDLTNEVNKCFGVAVLGVYVVLLMGIIRSVAMSLYYGIFEWPQSEFYCFVNIFASLPWLVLTHLLSTTCSKTKKTLREGSLLIYEVIVNIPPYKKYEQEELLQDDLILLAYSITNRHFGFTALGFYEIDCSLMFAMMGSIAYYVVILIQLK